MMNAIDVPRWSMIAIRDLIKAGYYLKLSGDRLMAVRTVSSAWTH